VKNNWVISQVQAKRNNMNISLKKLIFEAEGDVPPQKGAKPPTQAPAAAPKAAPAPKSPSPAPAPTPAAEKQPAPSGGEGDANTFNVKFDLDDFETKVSNSTEQAKNDFQSKILQKISNKQVRLVRAAKGFGQPEREYVVNVADVKIEFWYQKYVVVITGREQNNLTAPYVIKIMGQAQPSKSKKQTQPAAPKPVQTPQNTATKGL
jgi:hypothetical protein